MQKALLMDLRFCYPPMFGRGYGGHRWSKITKTLRNRRISISTCSFKKICHGGFTNECLKGRHSCYRQTHRHTHNPRGHRLWQDPPRFGIDGKCASGAIIIVMRSNAIMQRKEIRIPCALSNSLLYENVYY